MGLHIHSSVKKITNAQYIHVSNDRSWLNRSKHTTYYGKRNTWILRKFSSVQSLSHVWIFVTPWAGALQASLFITNSQSLLKLISIKSVMPSNHLILCHPLHLLPSILPRIKIFSNELVLCIEKTGWSQILGSQYPIYENLHEQLNLLEPLNIKIVLRINNNPPSKQQKLKKWQQSVEMAGNFLPSSIIRAISTYPDLVPLD